MTEKKKIKKKVIKKRVTQKRFTIIKKRAVRSGSKHRRVTKRRSKKRSVFLFGFLAKKWRKYNQVIRREQSRCLRYKKYKGKYAFCYVWALLNKYFKQTIIVVIILGVMGMFFTKDTFLELAIQGSFGPTLQTSLISDLTNKIRSLTGQIDDRKQCTEDKYWKPTLGEVCNYYLYQRKNDHCAKFNVPTTRIGIGTKMCCDGGKAGIYDKNKDKLTACPGADIFFHRDKIFPTTVVPDKDSCQLGACEFYPAKGFHAKLNEDGSLDLDENGNIKLEKDCAVTQKEGPCSKPCGGGKRIKYVRTKNCLTVKIPEACNMAPCTQESY